MFSLSLSLFLQSIHKLDTLRSVINDNFANSKAAELWGLKRNSYGHSNLLNQFIAHLNKSAYTNP